MVGAALLLVLAGPVPAHHSDWYRGRLDREQLELELSQHQGTLEGSFALSGSSERRLVVGTITADRRFALATRDGGAAVRFEGFVGIEGELMGTWSSGMPSAAKRGVELVPVSSAPPVGALEAWQREWRESGGGQGIIDVIALPGGYVRASGSTVVGTGEAAHTGDFLGLAVVKDGTARLVDEACEVTFVLKGRALQVADNGQCGGIGVSFSGAYR